MNKYISLRKLNRLLRGQKPFIVMWTLKPCPDCIAVRERFLPAYIYKDFKTNLPLYFIETLKYRKMKDKTKWENIKRIYGLSEELNPKSGYGTGFVPAFQVITPDGTNYVKMGDISPIITDMFVFQNEFVREENGTFVIDQSYFNGKRGTTYLGKYTSEINTVVTSDIVNPRNNSVRRYDENAAYLTKFLDYYYKA